MSEENAFEELKRTKEKAREISARVKKLRKQASEEKKLRDQANAKVRELKAKRDETNKRIKEVKTKLEQINQEIKKKMPEGASRGDIRREISRLEWDIQTKVMSPKKEEELAKRIEKLELQLKAWDEVDALFAEKKKLLSELDELRTSAQAFHEALLHYAKESEFHHSQLMEIIKQLKKLEPDFDEVKKKLAKAKENADKLRERISEERKAKAMERRAEIEAFQKEQEKEMKKMEAEMKKKAKELMAALKSGKKLTTEELMIIQTYLGDED